MSLLARVYGRLPRFAQVLVDDVQRLHEYPSFMRVAMTFGTLTFLYKFGQTMAYLETEKHQETIDQRRARRLQEKRMREQLGAEALAASRIAPPSDEHVRAVVERAYST